MIDQFDHVLALNLQHYLELPVFVLFVLEDVLHGVEIVVYDVFDLV